MSARPRRQAQRQEANPPPPAAMAAFAAAAAVPATAAAPAGPPTPWHDFLTGELGFSDVAATYIETTQGYNWLDALEDVTVKSITDLCDTMKKDRTNPTIAVIQPAEYGLIHTLYYVKGMQYCSRTHSIAGCTRDVRKSWAGFWENMKSHKEPTDMPDRKDFTDNWVRTFEILDEYLMRLIGNKCMVPLYYVVCKDAEVVPEANDPPTNYTSRWSEMCVRMPHYTTTAGVRIPMPTYEEDNRKVWDKLATIFDTSDDYTYMKPYQRERDGRTAYMALYGHFLEIHWRETQT
jgi:hypothetical protein